MTRRTKVINGKTYNLISSSNLPKVAHAQGINYRARHGGSFKVVRFNDKEAKFEDARYGVYVH